MDLIYANANHEDLGVLQDYELDLAFGADENNFECRIQNNSHCCDAGFYLYMEDTEYGGIIDSIESITEQKEVVYSGRTWHGILGSKVILPLQEGEAESKLKLPDGYTLLEYIKSSGTQYINTGFNPNQNTKVVCDIQLLGASLQCAFGARHGANNNSFFVQIQDTNRFRVDFGNLSNQSAFLSDMLNERKVITQDRNRTTLGEEGTYTTDAQIFQCNYPIFIGALNNAGLSSCIASAVIYSCQIYDNNVIVRNYVPCQNANGEAGLYDLTNGVFYPNAGSGVFAVGAIVEDEADTGTNDVTIEANDADEVSLVGRHLIISGDVNACIQFILDRTGLTDMFEASSEQAGTNIEMYQFKRFTDVFSGLSDMLSSTGLKLKLAFTGTKVLLTAEPIVDYTQAEEFDSDQIAFQVKKNYKTVNHLICLGSGEMENRMVAHLYVDSDGKISETQTQFDMDEIVAVFDYSNAESKDELISSGKERLRELSAPGDISIDFDADTGTYDIGDIVGAVDNVTHISVAETISKKIVTIKNGQVIISYKVGE